MDSCAPITDEADISGWAEAWIHARRTVLPKRLQAPGPSPQQLLRIVRAAAAAPDHDQQLPWRFVLVDAGARERLADAFERALVDRDSSATAEQRMQARDKAFRAPVLLLACARLAGGPCDIPDPERLVSLGCALQNMMLMATALGFASALTSGQAMSSWPLRALFSLTEHEHAVCFLNIGTAAGVRPAKARPATERFFSRLAGSAD